MSFREYVKAIPKRDKILIITLICLYVVGIALYFGFWEYFEHWNYLASLYLDRPLQLLLCGLCSLVSFILLIFSKRWLIKLLAIVSLPLPLLLISFIFLFPFVSLEVYQKIPSPDKKANIIVYTRSRMLSGYDEIIVVERVNHPFFPKTLYMSEHIDSVEEIKWLDNKHIRLIKRKKGEWIEPLKEFGETKSSYLPEKHYDITEDSPTIFEN